MRIIILKNGKKSYSQKNSNNHFDIYNPYGVSIYYKDTMKLYYNKKGRLHNTNGPAFIGPNKSFYFLDGAKYSKNEWKDMISNYKDYLDNDNTYK